MDSVTSKNRRDSISKDRGQRVLKRRNQTRNPAKAGSRRPSTQKDKENISTPEPKKRRTTQNGARSNVDKENDGGSDKNVPLMMSPTPYWKVARDRGNKHSPRLTRSAKKKVQQSTTNHEDGVMLFSPPNQAANAKREKMELEKKTRERNNRIEANRKNGQLLVFSKDFDSLTELPADDDEHSEHSTETVKQQSRKSSDVDIDNDALNSSNYNEETGVSSFSVDEERQASDLEEFSCLTKSTHHGEHSEEMMNAIKGLGQKFELLDRRLSEFPDRKSVV